MVGPMTDSVPLLIPKSTAGGATVRNGGYAAGLGLKKAYASVLVMAVMGGLTTGVAAAGSATLNIAIVPGNPIALELTPQSAGPSANDGQPACIVVLVKTALYGWTLGASYTGASSPQLDLGLEPASGGSCGAASNAAGRDHLTAGINTTLLSNQRGTAVFVYALTLQSSVPLASPATVTLTFTADAPGARAAQAALTVGLDTSGRVSMIQP
jgi:hypothetical protein